MYHPLEEWHGFFLEEDLSMTKRDLITRARKSEEQFRRRTGVFLDVQTDFSQPFWGAPISFWTGYMPQECIWLAERKGGTAVRSCISILRSDRRHIQTSRKMPSRGLLRNRGLHPSILFEERIHETFILATRHGKWRKDSAWT